MKQLFKKISMIGVLSVISLTVILLQSNVVEAVTIEDIANTTGTILCVGDPNGPDGTVDQNGIMHSYGLCFQDGNAMGRIDYAVNMQNFDTDVTFTNSRGIIRAHASGTDYFQAQVPPPPNPPSVVLIAGVADVTNQGNHNELGKYQHVTQVMFNVAMDAGHLKCLFGSNALIQ